MRSQRLPGVFLAVLGLVALLAAATAAGTTGPWFSGAVSAQVYAMSLLAAVFLAVALAIFAASHAARLDDARRSIDLRVATLPEAIHLPSGGDVTITPDLVRTIPPSDEEVDELLTTLATPSPDASAQAELGYTGTLVEVAAGLTAARTRREVLKVLLRERVEVETARARIRPTVAGPIAASLVLAFLAGAMLPGSEGFAARAFQLNTGLVLFLAYGLAFLAGWAVLAIGSLVGRPPVVSNGGDPPADPDPPTRS